MHIYKNTRARSCNTCFVLNLWQNLQLDKEVEQTEQKVERLGQENVQLMTKNSELEDENKDLEKGMREILHSIKEQGKVHLGHQGIG